MEEENDLEQYSFLFQDTTATKKIFSLTKRIRAVKGGTSASKTISILVWIIDYCQRVHERPKIVTTTSESYPHLAGGAMRDFISIMTDRGYWNPKLWNQNERTYTFETGNKLEFISAESGNKARSRSKAHGPRRDVLFINEANNVTWSTADQMMVRTREIVWLDWNPSEEFWFDIELLAHRPNDIDFITLTYLDNEALDEVMVSEIESHKHNLNWWKVYGKGELGEIVGRIYTSWKIIDEIPHEARLVRRGLDFGYSNDQTAIVDTYYYNGGYILDEQLYRKGMKNRQIADFLLNLINPETLVKADSAEPKSIDELMDYGIVILGVKKGKDSVNHGIQFVQDQKISVTSRSVNLIKEYRKYMWQTDRDGKIINTPEGGFDHLMDAVRYSFEDLIDDSSSKNKAQEAREAARAVINQMRSR